MAKKSKFAKVVVALGESVSHQRLLMISIKM